MSAREAKLTHCLWLRIDWAKKALISHMGNGGMVSLGIVHFIVVLNSLYLCRLAECYD